MIELQLKPTLYSYETCRDFVKELNIGEGDVMITNEYIYEPNFKALDLKCTVIFQEKYGLGEPSDEMAEAIYNDLPKGYKRIIAVGGGTILDLSKVFSLKQCHPILDLFDGKIEPVKDKELILVPTTCGTGSEVTNVAVFALISRHTKKGIAYDTMYGDKAVLITDLLKTLPFKVFATSSIDALVHAVESALSPDSSATFRVFSYNAIKLILEGYKKIRDNGPEGRIPLMKDFLLAANWAGIAFSIPGCAAVHAMSYPLGSEFHVPHGESNYAMFTGVMNCYMKYKTDGEIATMNAFLADILGCDIKDVYVELECLLDTILPKKALHEYGVTEAQLPEFAASVIENQQRLLKHSFIQMDYDKVLAVYKSLY
ncbi:MAG: 4-hydroxybutyrate dehydrogenase [Megasphaera sp.]|nr:4-hydroxybutyrate dehydrogenase [Megasphaera sp.]MCH4188107.1 4-hydroxybutyrate dehydrogenase [Megasphaera sp.]MCH4217945.1 4-hydroxybutyrate dehydrogenase [Megasphaera sp.]